MLVSWAASGDFFLYFALGFMDNNGWESPEEARRPQNLQPSGG